MNNTLHTPGPWHYRSSAHGKSTFGLSIFHGTAPDKEGIIADLSGRYKSYRTEAEIGPETLANAHLISAAPDLLSALENLMARCVKDAEHYAPDGNEAIWAFISDASDAIAKAKGAA